MFRILPPVGNAWRSTARGFAWSFALLSILWPIPALLSWMGPRPAIVEPQVPPDPGNLMKIEVREAPPPNNVALMALYVSLGALAVSGIGTTSTIILGWRSERRQSAESKLKIKQLELQIAEARREGGPA